MKTSLSKEIEKTRRIFDKTVRECGLIRRKDRVLVALSGGKDSVCLLLLLCERRREWDLDVLACYVHHGMRKRADRDEAFCRKLCLKLSVPFFVRRVDAPAYAKAHGLSPEMAARALRYRELKQVSSEQKAILATAHTASDNTENVLLALLRGGGISALSGIAPRRADGVIRPLIRLSAKDTEAYCRALGQAFITDETNRDTRLPRNFLRREIIPRLKRRNPNLDRTVFSVTQTLRAQRLALEASFAESRKRLGIEKTDRGAPVSVLAPLAKTEATHALLYDILSGFLQAAGDYEPLSAERFHAVCEVLAGGSSDKRVEVSGEYSFTFAGMLYAERVSEISTKPCFVELAELSEDPLVVSFASHAFRLSWSEGKTGSNVYKFHTTCVLDCDKIIGKLSFRTPDRTDVLCCGGQEKDLSDLFSERKLPLGLRKTCPVLCDEQGVLWVPGELCDDRVAPEHAGKRLSVELISGEIKEILLQKRRQYE